MCYNFFSNLLIDKTVVIYCLFIIYLIIIINHKFKYCYYFKIEINLSGLTPNHKHGFHVHEAGDLSDHCKSACAHFNPYNKTHGCPGKEDRHIGDLGNLIADENGNAIYSTNDDMIKLKIKW